MSKEVKHRRGTNSQVEAVPYAEGELIYNISKKRFHGGDGSSVGGTALPNYKEIINQTYVSGVTTGTGDDYELQLEVPLDAYEDRQRFLFTVDRNNGGPSTLNVDGVGELDIKKKSGGVLVDLEADDLIDGCTYDAVRNGSSAEILNELSAQAPITSVSQGNINTSLGSISSNGSSVVALPGGEYGFAPQLTSGVSNVAAMAVLASSSNGYVTGLCLARSSNSPTAISFGIVESLVGPIYYMAPRINGGGTSGQATAYAQQRYVNSSPPFDLGDGDAESFMYLQIDNSTGDVIGHYFADVPPWGYNGPTRIRCDYQCPKTHRKFRKVRKKRTLEEILNNAAPDFELQEITQKIKNADMDLIPDPFGTTIPGQSIVLLDHMNPKLGNLLKHQQDGGIEDIIEAISQGHIKADNEKLSRKGPSGLMIVKPVFKNSSRLNRR